MKRHVLISFLSLAVGTSLFAGEDLDEYISRQIIDQQGKVTAPEVEAKKIINESNSFLKEREPEMTSEEYALYEKVVTMLSTNADFALKMLEGMMNDKEPPSPAFEFILGNTYYAANQTDKAEERYKSAVKRYPSFLRAWNNLGVLYYTSQRYGDAVKCFSKSVSLGDRDANTFGLLGYSLEQQGDPISAEMAYMQALSGDPANSDWKEGLLRIYIDGQQFGRAEPLVKKLIKDRPTEGRLWLTYANILLSQKRKPEATAVLEAAVGAGASSTEELTVLGDLYAEQNLTDEAVGIYQKILATSRDLGERKLLHFAQVLIAAKRFKEADDTLRGLPAQLTPEGRQSMLQTRANLLVAQEHWAEARKQIETLLQSAPLDGQALLTLGETYVGEQNLARAQLAFEAAYRVPQSAYRASLELANVELKNRHYAKTVEYLEKALSIQKTDAVADYLARVRTLVGSETHSE